jgi:hypothetical protein
MIPQKRRLLRRGTLPLLAFALSLPLVAGTSVAQKFETPRSDVPFSTIAESHPIDGKCRRGGSDDGNDLHRAQNAAKNDFTEKGAPVTLAFNDFSRLQRDTDSAIADGEIKLKGKYPDDRSQLKKRITVQGKPIGEGTVVRLEAYVFGAHYSNTKLNTYPGGKHGEGEANNCDNDELDWNDIHIALIGSTTTGLDECNTVTAEISPHYRPETWASFHDGLNSDIEALVPGLLRHKVVQRAKAGDEPLHVRITGPLFYDASHSPCKTVNGKLMRNSPARRSIWEIHPVYRVEVFDKKWVELDKWAKAQ